MIRQEVLQFVHKASISKLKRALIPFLVAWGLVSIVVLGLGSEAQAAPKDKNIAGEWGLTASGFNVSPATPEGPAVLVGTFIFAEPVGGEGDCHLLVRVHNTSGTNSQAGGCKYDLDPDGDGSGIGEITVPGLAEISFRFVVVDGANEIRFTLEGPPGQIASGVAKRQ